MISHTLLGPDNSRVLEGGAGCIEHIFVVARRSLTLPRGLVPISCSNFLRPALRSRNTHEHLVPTYSLQHVLPLSVLFPKNN